MISQTLKNKTIKGLTWNAIDKFLVTGITFVFGIILARILMPSDYGLIGMLAIFFAFSKLFVESGFSQGLIQKKDRTEVDFSTIFYFNIAVSLFFYLILYFSAPYIADFFHVPQLKSITRVLSLNIVFSSLALVQTTRLIIKLDFKTQAIISLVSVLVSGVAGIICAYKGFGVWALVIQYLLRTFVTTFLLFIFNKWIPLFVFSMSSFRQLFRFSSKLLAAGFLAILFRNIYSLLIGKIYHAKDLGYYTKAKQYPELLSNTITTILQNVSFPVLASLQDDRERLIYVYRKLMRVTVYFIIPALMLFAVLAKPIIHILLTDKWLPVVPYLQWLCFARMITPVSSLNMNILNAVGRSDLFLKLDILKLPLAIIILFITVPMGVQAIVIGNVFLTFVNFFINAYYPGKMFGFGVWKQLVEMKSTVIASIIMYFSIYSIMMIITGELLQILVGIPVAFIIYVLLSYLFRIEERKVLFEIVNTFTKKKST